MPRRPTLPELLSPSERFPPVSYKNSRAANEMTGAIFTKHASSIGLDARNIVPFSERVFFCFSFISFFLFFVSRVHRLCTFAQHPRAVSVSRPAEKSISLPARIMCAGVQLAAAPWRKIRGKKGAN